MRTETFYDIEDLKKGLKFFDEKYTAPVLAPEIARDIARECIQNEITRRANVFLFEDQINTGSFHEGYLEGWKECASSLKSLIEPAERYSLKRLFVAMAGGLSVALLSYALLEYVHGTFGVIPGYACAVGILIASAILSHKSFYGKKDNHT